jgi:hypothetical protein
MPTLEKGYSPNSGQAISKVVVRCQARALAG